MTNLGVERENPRSNELVLGVRKTLFVYFMKHYDES